MRKRKLIKCVVKGCLNYKGEGKFIKDLCHPCWHILTSGRLNPTDSILQYIKYPNLKEKKDADINVRNIIDGLCLSEPISQSSNKTWWCSVCCGVSEPSERYPHKFPHRDDCGYVLGKRWLVEMDEEAEIDAIMNQQEVSVCGKCRCPLILTFVIRGAEWYCLNCGNSIGMFGCRRLPATRLLIDLHLKVREDFKNIRRDIISNGAMRSDCEQCQDKHEYHVLHCTEKEIEKNKSAWQLLEDSKGKYAI